MYISEYWVGVGSVLLAEIVLCTIIILYSAHKDNQFEREKEDEK